MKDPKLLVTIRETSRLFYIYRRKRKGIPYDYYINFHVPRAVQDRLGLVQPKVFRSLGTPLLAAARERAKEILRSVFSHDGGQSAEADKLRHERVAFVSEVVQAYRDGARSISDKEDLKEATINGNIGCLKKLLSGGVESRHANADRHGTGSANPAAGVSRAAVSDNAILTDGQTFVGVTPGFSGHSGSSAPPAQKFNQAFGTNASTICLTSDLIEAFKRRELDPVRDDPVALESKKRSVNSTIRQARSIFSKEYMPLYAHLNLPDLTGFREARLCKVDRHGTRYVPIPQAKIDAMEAEVRAMREARPAIYLAFFMMLWLGMRQNEVREARLEWIEEWPSGAQMAIVRRRYFKPKGIPGNVSLAPQLLEDIQELSGAKAAEDYLIPAATETERRNLLRYDLSQFVRRHLGDDRTKTCHELRKHAISMQLMRTRNYVDTLKFSRHSDVKTLMDHYGTFLDTLPPITSSNWRTDALLKVG